MKKLKLSVEMGQVQTTHWASDKSPTLAQS